MVAPITKPAAIAAPNDASEPGSGSQIDSRLQPANSGKDPLRQAEVLRLRHPTTPGG